MILDSSFVTLPDGSQKPAIDVSVGAVITSYPTKKAIVTKKEIHEYRDTISMHLSTGKDLTVTRKQQVCVAAKVRRFKMAADLEVGSRLLGVEGTTPTTVYIFGMTYDDEPKRMVDLYSDRDYVAQGVLCRS